jgi:alpha-tubulin suppressor-like RCC1 family protein
MRYISILFIILLVGCSPPSKKSDETESTANTYCTIYQCPIGKPKINSYPIQEITLKEGDVLPNMIPSIEANADNIYFRVIPQLPTGMFFNTETGEISGYALKESPLREYRVIIDNRIYNLTTGEYIAGGYDIYPLYIQVNKIKPTSLSYHDKRNLIYYRQVLGTSQEVDLPETISFLSLDKNESFIPLSPNSLGGSVEEYSISPELPAGLIFNTETGEISGRPLVDQQNTVYSIKAKNNGGEVSFLLSLEIKGVAPFNLQYFNNDSFYLSGERINNNFPIYSGDLATNFSVLPALPDGLFINSSTGEITGYPKNPTNRTEFIVRASNNWGYTEASIFIEVRGNISKISTGEHHSCAIKNKEVYCWGSNQVSQLGYETGLDELCFNEEGVLNSCYKKAKKVFYDSIALEAIDIVSSSNTTCALTEDKKILCWGLNDQGQLGINSLENNLIEKSYVIKDNGEVLSNVEEIGAGYNHFCARDSQLNVYCWGDNTLNQIKDSINGYYTKALYIIGDATALSVGYSHNCVLRNNMGYCWGDNSQNNLGYNESLLNKDIDVPVEESMGNNFNNIEQIITGYYSSFILRGNDLYSFGLNSEGQIDGTLVNYIYPINTDKDFNKELSLGIESQCFIDINNEVACWGKNNHNFGNGSLDDSMDLTYIVNSNNEKYSAEKISKGYSDFRCISNIDNVYCFGKNHLGQLGDNTTLGSLNPKAVIFE